MANQSFGYRSIARCLIPADFENDKALRTDDDYKTSVIKNAVVKASQAGVNPASISSIEVGKNAAYGINNLADLLVLRKCAANVRQAFYSKMKQRNQIVRELQSFLSDGTKYRLYKLDITAFFESVNNDQLKAILQTSSVSAQTQRLVLEFMDAVELRYGSGLPRGIGLSSVLSEVYMNQFDSNMSECSEIDYFSRFVDDMIIITQGTECITGMLKRIQESLPRGLELNARKQTIIDVPLRTRGTLSGSSIGDVVANFSHLGYSIRVLDTKTSREEKTISRSIVTDISPNKIKTLKTRVSRSFYSFTKNDDFALLIDRLTFLTTNRFFMNKKKKRLIPSGIYYSHSVIDPNSPAIDELDRFLHSIVLYNTGRIGKAVSGKITPLQRRELLSVSFTKGFGKRQFKRYSPNRMKKLAKIFK